MMTNPIVVNNLDKKKIICTPEKITGDIIYSGHKMAIDPKTLSQVLQYYYDKNFSRFIFIDWMKWKYNYAPEELNREMTSCFFYNNNNKDGLQQSYMSLLDLIKSEFGNFRKINFIRINDN